MGGQISAIKTPLTTWDTVRSNLWMGVEEVSFPCFQDVCNPRKEKHVRVEHCLTPLPPIGFWCMNIQIPKETYSYRLWRMSDTEFAITYSVKSIPLDFALR